MKLLTEAQRATLLDFVMSYDKHSVKFVPDVGTPVKILVLNLTISILNLMNLYLYTTTYYNRRL